MSVTNVVDLAECSEFRQTLAARPPRIVHGAALLLVAMLTAAVTWAALVKANLVVRAAGRVRSVDTPARVFTPAGTRLEGRVAEVFFKEGQTVTAGQTLLRLDTKPLDNEISKLSRTIEAAEQEVAKFGKLEVMIGQQYSSAKAKAEAELKQEIEQVERQQQRQASKLRAAQAELRTAQDKFERMKKLVTKQTVTESEVIEAETKARQATERCRQAQLPADEGRVEVFRRALKLVEREFAVKRAEVEARRIAKHGDADAARKELANLELQRDQSVLRSPIDGVVVSGDIRPSDVLQPGKPAIEIARSDDFVFEATVASEDAGQLRVGMPVCIKFDAYDYQKYGTLAGTVRFISPDSKPVGRSPNPSPDEAALANPPSSPAYLVRITVDSHTVGRGDHHGDVKLGLGGKAEIVTDCESVLMILVKKVRQTVSLG